MGTAPLIPLEANSPSTPHTAITLASASGGCQDPWMGRSRRSRCPVCQAGVRHLQQRPNGTWRKQITYTHDDDNSMRRWTSWTRLHDRSGRPTPPSRGPLIQQPGAPDQVGLESPAPPNPQARATPLPVDRCSSTLGTATSSLSIDVSSFDGEESLPTHLGPVRTGRCSLIHGVWIGRPG